MKSLFIPPYALQGEDIPGHIIWDKFNFECIKIELPETMLKKQLFNVREEMVETFENTIIVRNGAIEVDGYLGMLFSSKRIKDLTARSRILFSFVGENNAILLKQSREIYLFRPDVELVETPREIKIDVKKGFVQNRIKVTKNEEGTLILKIQSAKDSEIQIRTPDSIIEYRNRLLQNLRDEYTPLEKAYPRYRDFMETHISIMEKGWLSQDDLKKFRDFIINLNRILLKDEDFAEKFFLAIMNSLWRSKRFLSLPERLLKYLESIAHKKIWLARPENVITVSPEPRLLKLEIMPADRLLDAYNIIKVPSIKVTGNEKGEIEIVKFFEWV